MSEEPTSSRSKLREEAAHWFVIMRGADVDAHREEFDEWLKRGALHRRAYNSVAETFTLGKLLKEERGPATEMLPPRRDAQAAASKHRTTKTAAAVIACTVGISAIAVSWHVLKPRSEPDFASNAGAPSGADTEARYATTIGEVRNFALPDGTKMILDTDSLILASFTPDQSSLRLIKGRARFFSSPAKRALVVRADTIVIRGKDAVYDVALRTDTHVTVNPIDGHVMVQYGAGPRAHAAAPDQGSAISIAHIDAGTRLDLQAGQRLTGPTAAAGGDNWPEGVEQFDDVRLSRLVADANRYTRKPIQFSDAGIAELRISGTFHLTDTKRLAQQIAQLLDMRANEERAAFLLTPACPEKTASSCPSPS